MVSFRVRLALVRTENTTVSGAFVGLATDT